MARIVDEELTHLADAPAGTRILVSVQLRQDAAKDGYLIGCRGWPARELLIDSTKVDIDGSTATAEGWLTKTDLGNWRTATDQVFSSAEIHANTKVLKFEEPPKPTTVNMYPGLYWSRASHKYYLLNTHGQFHLVEDGKTRLVRQDQMWTFSRHQQCMTVVWSFPSQAVPTEFRPE